MKREIIKAVIVTSIAVTAGITTIFTYKEDFKKKEEEQARTIVVPKEIEKIVVKEGKCNAEKQETIKNILHDMDLNSKQGDRVGLEANIAELKQIMK